MLKEVRRRIMNNFLESRRTPVGIRAKIKRLQKSGQWTDYITTWQETIYQINLVRLYAYIYISSEVLVFHYYLIHQLLLIILVNNSYNIEGCIIIFFLSYNLIWLGFLQLSFSSLRFTSFSSKSYFHPIFLSQPTD